MTKGDTPAFQMTIERGHLVPATAWDAERLDTYRNGSKVRVRFVEDRDRVMIRKWWALLNLVVKQCDVPWKNAEQASEAIKLALGIVNLTKTVGGKFLQYPKSLTELSDPELDDAVRDMMDLIQRMTGIDPETLRKETADVGHEEQESQEASPPPEATSDGSGEEASPCEDPAPTNPAAADQAEPEETVKSSADSSGSAIDNVTRNLMVEAMDKFLYLATDKDVPDPKERRGILAKTKDAWKDALPQHHSFVKACFEAADRIIKGKSKEADERDYLVGLVERAQA